jgi:hypothetical protein
MQALGPSDLNVCGKSPAAKGWYVYRGGKGLGPHRHPKFGTAGKEKALRGARGIAPQGSIRADSVGCQHARLYGLTAPADHCTKKIFTYGAGAATGGWAALRGVRNATLTWWVAAPARVL